MSKTITFSASKGGVGKTTMTFNFASFLVRQGYKVLLIDSDYQGNLSSTYESYTNKNTLYDVFTGALAQIRQITPQLGLLPASPHLDELEGTLQSKNNKNFLMMMWLQDHLEEIKDYDYILIDTHPEFGTLTKNMIAVSDYVVVPLEPSEYGFIQSKQQFDLRMKEFRDDAVDIRTRESLIEAKVLYLANRVKHNTRSSHEFGQIIDQIDNLVAVLNEREVFNSSTMLKTPVFDLEQAKRNPKTLQQINEAYQKLLESVK